MEILYDVPLISQHWDLGKWKQFGFDSWNDAEYWQRSSCGILCIQEIASYFNEKSYSTQKLIVAGQKLDGYSDEYGWKHEGLVRLAESLNLHAKRERTPLDDLKNALDNKKLAIVSIKWAFIPQKSLKERLLFWKKYGGHLAVVTGYNDKGFYVNHTSKILEQNWKARLIPFSQFSAGYTGRAILVWK